MVTATARRVTAHTSDKINNQIAREIDIRLTFYAEYPEKIDQRLRELDHEWDVERALETGASTLTLTGLVLSKTVSRRWLLLSLGVQGFFLQHALQGWCPPLPILRRLGFRTADEINHERHALVELRESGHQTESVKKKPANARKNHNA